MPCDDVSEHAHNHAYLPQTILFSARFYGRYLSRRSSTARKGYAYIRDGRVVASRFLWPGLGEEQICFHFFWTREGHHRSRRSLRRPTILTAPFPFSAPGGSYPAFPASSSPPHSSPPLPTRTSISPASTLHLSSPDFVYVILHKRRQVVRLHRISFAHSSPRPVNIARDSTPFSTLQQQTHHARPPMGPP